MSTSYRIIYHLIGEFHQSLEAPPPPESPPPKPESELEELDESELL
jgi:hypothetical protein